MSKAACICGCDYERHEHFHSARYCGHCGKYKCDRYRSIRKRRGMAMAQGRKNENSIPDHVFDEVLVERIVKGKDAIEKPDRKPSQREAIEIIRRMHPAKSRTVISKAVSRHGAQYDELFDAAFPERERADDCHTNTSAKSDAVTTTPITPNRSTNAITVLHLYETGTGTKNSCTPLLALLEAVINERAADTEILLVAAGRVGDWSQVAETDSERETVEYIRAALVAAAHDIGFAERPELIRFARAMMGRLDDD